MSNKKQTMKTSVLLALLAVYFIQSGANAVNSTLQTIQEAFPGVSPASVRLISTIPNITSLLVGLCLGSLIGKKVRYKTVFLIGILFFIIGGSGPAILHTEFVLILAFRFLFGISVGCFSFLNAYVLSSTEKEEQAKYIGYGAVSANIGGAVLQMVCGSLADRQWYLSFYPYLIGILSLLLLLLFFRESEIMETDGNEQQGKQPSAISCIKGRAGIYLGIQFLLMITCISVMTGMAAVLAERNLGGATVVAMVLTVCQVGGILAGVIFGTYTRVLRRYAMPAGLLIQGLGILFVLVGQSLFLVGLGSFVSGLGTIICASMNATFAGQSVAKPLIPLITVWLMVIGQLANFLSNYFVLLCDKLVGARFVLDVESSYFVSCFVYGALILTITIFNSRTKSPI